MFGNVANNRQLSALMERGLVEISEFESADLGPVHYTLRIGSVLEIGSDGQWFESHNFEEGSQYLFEPEKYVIFVAKQRLRLLDDRIVGDFSPASNLIESGISLSCGKIDKEYGKSKNQQLHFGARNNLSSTVKVEKSTRIAHVKFYDLTGLASDKSDISDDEWNTRLKRFLRESDDGPNYDEP